MLNREKMLQDSMILEAKIENDSKVLKTKMEEIYKRLRDEEISCKMFGRVKTPLSRFINWLRGVDFDDIKACTIIVNSEDECYRVLKILKEMFPTKKTSDYITNPRSSGYTALHGNFFYDTNQERPFEVQIKTPEMFKRAEAGKASHYNYKNFLNNEEFKPFKDLFSDRKMKWRPILRALKELGNDKVKEDSFISQLKNYAKKIGIDLDQLNSANNMSIKYTIEYINWKLGQTYARKEDKNILRYIHSNRKIIDGLNSKTQSDRYKAIIRYLRKQTYYFIINQILDSKDCSIRKMGKKIKKLGQTAELTFSEMCIMCNMEDLHLNYKAVEQLWENRKTEFYFIGENGKLVSIHQKKDIIDRIIGGNPIIKGGKDR